MAYKVLLDDIDVNRDAFVKLHGESDHYGGSSVANICGVGFDSPLKEWLRRTGKTPPVEQTLQMELGSYLEPMLARMLSKKINSPVQCLKEVWQSEEQPWMIASPDALVDDGEGIAEFKVHKVYADKYWQEGGASDSAMCQLQWYLAVSGFDHGYCAALIGGDTEKFYTPFFESDPELQSQLIEQVERFRELVQSDTPPEAGPDDSKAIQEHLAEEYHKERELDLTDSHKERIDRYRELAEETDILAQQLDPLKKEMTGIKNQFFADSHGAGTILVGKNKVKLTKVERKGHTVQPSTYFKVTVKLEDQ